MQNTVEMVKYKLRRARQLATPRFVHWLFLQRFRSGVTLTQQICESVTVRYLPQGNVSRDLYLGQFELETIDFFSHHLRPGMIVFDVGANIGVYSLLSAKHVGKGGAIHSFEPTPSTFAQLQANVELNGFACINLNQLAVAEQSGTSNLFLYEQNAMNSLSRQDWVGTPLGQVAVETISLDEYVDAEGLATVNLLKLDVEGAELGVLKGARRLLSGPNPPVVVCEFADKTTYNFGYRAADLRDYLASLGYQFFRWNRKSRSLVPEALRRSYEIYANLVCIREGSPVSETHHDAKKT
jgi:FkbM family methyltransferase